MRKTHRYVDLSNLPHNKAGVDWKRCAGYDFYFEYRDIKGYLHIEDVSSKKIKVSYKGSETEIIKSEIKNVPIGKLLGTYASDFKIDIGEHIKDDKRDMIITDKEVRINKKGWKFRWYKYKCNKCGWTEGWIDEYHLLEGKGCSCCSKRVVVRGINDISTTDSWMVELFENEKDAYENTYQSEKYKNFECPDCGRIIKRRISDTYKIHGVGCICSDGKSYPEKFMNNVLIQLKLNVINQYNKSYAKWCKNYLYDFYLPDYNIIIETHGEQHYKKSQFRRTIEEQKNIDKDKKELALKNNISSYIEIDCRESSINWIRNSILNSDINKKFDLSKVD